MNGGTPASGDESYWDGETVWLTPDDLGRNSKAWISESRRRITDEGVSNSSARVSPEGSIILSTRAPIGHIAITAVPAATNQGCRTLVPNPETDSSFAYYSLIASRSLLQALGKGTTFMELTPTELGGFRMARPPLDEQQAIAAFLDRQTAKIDVLVAKERLLLDRLAEYRTALITRTVTKGLPPEAAREAGLNPNPPLKPSGVEWIGDIPEHWEVTHLRRYVKMIKTGTTPPADKLNELAGDEIAWYSPGDIGSVLQMKLPARTLAHIAVVDRFTPLFPAESTLIVGIGATTGRVGHTTRPATGNQQLTCIVGDDRVFPRFLSWQLWARTNEIRAIAPYATLPILNNQFLLSLSFMAPSPREQQAIAAFLDEQTEQIDVLCSRVETAIERLQEYRTALITAAVTGKIDVREHERIETGASRT